MPIMQVLVLLCPPSEETEIEAAFVLGTTYHEYTILKLWTQDPRFFLEDPALLPFAPLTQGMDSAVSLSQVAEKVSKIEPEVQRGEVSAHM
jgi:predicted transposase YdaD